MSPHRWVVRQYEERIFPFLMDRLMARPYFDRLRRSLLEEAQGRVCEVGFGTGLNCPCLPSSVSGLVGIDPNPGMKPAARSRAAAAAFPANVVQAAAEELPLAGSCFDAVVCTYTLCSVDDPALVLGEVRRVLKSAGRLYLLEHGLHPNPRVRRWQRRIEPLHRRLAGGCRLTRDPAALAEASGFIFERLHRFQSPFGGWAGYMTLGAARRR